MRRLLVGALMILAACGGTDPSTAVSSTTLDPSGPTSSGPVGTDATVPNRPELREIEPFGQGGAEFTAADGTVTCSCVLVADTRDERNQGLMNVTDLEGYSGMVFVFDEDTTVPFIMRDTPMPLSIAWIAAEGSLVSSADMDPCLDGSDCVRYGATGSYRTALEVPQGDLAMVGAVDGATFRLVDECAD